jgi:hypothetical protein
VTVEAFQSNGSDAMLQSNRPCTGGALMLSISHKFYKLVTKVSQECYKMLQSVTRVLQECYRSVTLYSGVPLMVSIFARKALT